MTERPVVVVGSSLAGVSAVETLREAGTRGPLLLIGEEPHQPYDRPPLSKQLLLGTGAPGDTALRPDGHLRRLGVELHLGRRAVALVVLVGRPGLRTRAPPTPRRRPRSAAPRRR
ncbi:FAD-dependent oxidoreductase, partial [Streptomyces sp. NPDC002346]